MHCWLSPGCIVLCHLGGITPMLKQMLIIIVVVLAVPVAAVLAVLTDGTVLLFCTAV